jgi:hypothetical protein
MSDNFQTANVKLVTILASSELGDRIESDLRALGVSGYTKAKASGWGVHGAREFGIVSDANVRLDTLVGIDLARKILQAIAANYAGQPLVAFSQDAEAIPSHHFG